MTLTHEEYVTAAIAKQVQMLKDLIYEIETERLQGEALAWRIRAVEDQLHRIEASVEPSHEAHPSI